jgi:hypothetical protein
MHFVYEITETLFFFSSAIFATSLYKHVFSGFVYGGMSSKWAIVIIGK